MSALHTFRVNIYSKKGWNIRWTTGIIAMELIGGFTLKSAMAYNQLVSYIMVYTLIAPNKQISFIVEIYPL